MSRKVTLARIHTSAHIPGVGEIGNAFPSPTKTLDNLTMVTTELGLSVEFSFRGIKKEVLVPYTNIVLMDLAPEESVAAKKTSK